MDTTTQQVSLELAGRKLILKTGFLAPQANATCIAQYGDTVVLATATASEKPLEEADFLPLVVNVEEKFYAAGKIGGSRFIRREGRPSDSSILASRLVDRPLRPLFDKNVRNEIQVIATILSTDFENQPDILSMIAASAALHVSDIPWAGPVAGVRVGLDNGNFILNPSPEQIEQGKLDLVVAGTAEAVVMVEAGARELPEEKLLHAIEFGHEAIKKITDLQEQLRQKAGQEKKAFKLATSPVQLYEKINHTYRSKIKDAAFVQLPKKEKQRYVDQLKEEIVEQLTYEDTTNPDNSSTSLQIENVFDTILREVTRESIITEKKRIDNRKPDEIRPINCQVNLLPRNHGSALFTRGETQVLSLTTLGAPSASQLIEGIEEEETIKKHYLHHYNAPPFSLGIVSPLRGPKRREIGHGRLAERALEPVLPLPETFPYTIRVVSEVLSQNGSSSMASTCASTLALMDAGIPITKPVAGIAMGLIKEQDAVVILSDIQGWEDALGDMDFKVTGTVDGVTALQLDIKTKGLTKDILKQALDQAHVGRMHILAKMNACLAQPRPELSPYAPRLIQLQVNPEKVGLVIGPAGKTIKKIIEQTGVVIDIEDEGKIIITGTVAEDCERAKAIIEELTAEVEIGKIYEGKVVKVADYGAFVEILPGQVGMVHISKWAQQRIAQMSDVVKEGDVVRVKVTGIDDQDRIVLSKKEVE